MRSLWGVLAGAARPETALHLPFEGRSVPLRQLLADADRTAGLLGPRPVPPGQLRIGLLMANGEPWLRGLLASFRASAAAIPLPLPVAFGGPQAYLRHIQRIAADSAMDVLLFDQSCRRLLPRLEQALPRVRFVDVSQPPDGGAHPAGGGELALADGEPLGALAVIQYTSGSTSAPKGVALTAANVLAGLESLARGVDWTTDDVAGIWVPLFHDMGLFTTLSALAYGSSVCVWRPSDFIRNTRAWLESFAASPVTSIAMPNFSFEYILQAVTDGIPDGLDLSGWRIAHNGAEPVQRRTIEAFTTAFASYGFRPETMRPCYGLAEATLVVSWPEVGRRPRSLTVNRFRLSPGDRVEPARGGSARDVVSVGRAVPGMEVRVAGPDGVVGEVQLRGAAVMSGYLNIGPADQPFTADGWLRTGDLGFFDDDDLFLVGRLRDMIIVRGQNYYAEDVEEIVRAIPGVDRRHCVAVGLSEAGDDAELMAVLVETSHRGADAAELAAKIEAAVGGQLGLAAIRVHPVEPRSIPYTSSGKVRRRAARQMYERDIIGVSARGWREASQ